MPIPIPIIAAAISAAGSIGGGILGKQGSQETKTQKQQRELVDDLIASLKGGGSYNDLFSSDYETFQKSYVEPAKSLFKNQIAPQIQQQYIATGQQGGSGLEDQLLRAGVDMDQLLNQQYGQFQENALNRKYNAMNSILSQGSGAPNAQTTGQAAAQVGAGYLSSEGFQTNLDSILDYYKNKNQSTASNDVFGSVRKGFAQ